MVCIVFGVRNDMVIEVAQHRVHTKTDYPIFQVNMVQMRSFSDTRLVLRVCMRFGLRLLRLRNPT